MSSTSTKNLRRERYEFVPRAIIRLPHTDNMHHNNFDTSRMFTIAVPKNLFLPHQYKTKLQQIFLLFVSFVTLLFYFSLCMCLLYPSCHLLSLPLGCPAFTPDNCPKAENPHQKEPKAMLALFHFFCPLFPCPLFPCVIRSFLSFGHAVLSYLVVWRVGGRERERGW